MFVIHPADGRVFVEVQPPSTNTRRPTQAALIEQLPLLERDILWMHLGLRKSQVDIAKILGVSQPTINYRYKRARERLDFLEKLPKVSCAEIREVLERLGTREQDIEAMVGYVQTNSQSEVARRLNTSQSAVRHWIHRALVNHLQTDLSEDDLHKRVRIACAMLVSRPGLFHNEERTSRSPQGTQRLNPPPRTLGTPVEGEMLLFLEGLYAGLRGDVLQTSPEVLVRLELASQEILLAWGT